ncbi:MAG: YfbU family protein [Lachnospiraceae bacterium]|nr:YfbU family protein [Lachnospiraceae bacterium]
MNNKQRYENLQHGFYAGAGKYDIPQLTGSKITDFPELIGFNYAKTTKNRQNKGVHFFLDDYQFLRLWNNPTAYLDILKGFRCVLTPDFSLYADFPTAMQIYNHYRKHYVYAKWLVKNNHKFEEFENCEFNSHWNILPRYEEMLERFYEVTKDKEKGIYSTNLSADELNYIIDKK